MQTMTDKTSREPRPREIARDNRLGKKGGDPRRFASETTDPLTCDYPTCSRRGAGHPLACGCRSAVALIDPKTSHPQRQAFIDQAKVAHAKAVAARKDQEQASAELDAILRAAMEDGFSLIHKEYAR